MWTTTVLSLLLLVLVLLDAGAIATRVIEPYQSGSPLPPDEDKHGGIPMGILSGTCDDGQTNLAIDWDGSAFDFVCPTDRWTSNKGTHPITRIKVQCADRFDNPVHICMNRGITYHDVIPTSGAHRPLWAKFGEYQFLPKQRWIHNLEHGAAVLLYHPCADPAEVRALKEIVRGCLRKHIITPFKELSRERPFAVVTYGCKLELPYVDAARVRAFLRKHANTAPERRVTEDGQFGVQLIVPAKVVSNLDECEICPKGAFESCPATDLSPLFHPVPE